jgi:hypothetical protein
MQSEVAIVGVRKNIFMSVERALYLRIDTTDSKPYLEGPSASELVVMALMAGKEKGWYDLLSFVVMPKEVQLLIVPRKLSTKQIVEHLEGEVHPFLSALKWVPGPVFDPELYQERIEMMEDIRQRRRIMHNSPVKAGLAPAASAYSFSTANPRYQDVIEKID